MKKSFLISMFAILFVPTLMSSGFKQNSINEADDKSVVTNIPSENYLNLNYSNGTFFPWDQSNTGEEPSEQYIIGVFSTNEQSYLLDNFGVFHTLEYEISKFSAITNQLGVALIKYFEDENGAGSFNESFIVKLENNKITIVSPILFSENPNFTVLDKNNLVAAGIGLDLIILNDDGEVSSDSKNLIPPYANDKYFKTSFVALDENRGIFVGDDKYFYYLSDIKNNVEPIKINLTTPNQNTNVVVIDKDHVVLRTEGNALYYVDVNQPNVLNAWMNGDQPVTSNAKNLAFIVNDESFILNIAVGNSSTEYGSAFLVKKSDWDNLQEIPNIATVSNFAFTNQTEGKGIFVDKDLQAYSFVYADDKFTTSNLGALYNFQLINQDLIFGSLNGNNFLISGTPNKTWAFNKSIKFVLNSSKTTDNLLNNVIATKDEEISYQNTYFANGSSSITVEDSALQQIQIEDSSGGIRIIKPSLNSDTATYDFLNFDEYKVTISFFSDSTTYELVYQVKIVNFAKQELVKILSSGSTLNSYVGSSKEVLYDIKAIDQKDTFTIDGFNYNYLQYAELTTFGDTKDMVVKSLHLLQPDTEVKINNQDKSLFFGVRIVNLLNQVNWIYLGFTEDGKMPMTDFWDTAHGQDLLNQALMHRYLERDLRAMNSNQVKNLLLDSNNWHSIAVQGKAIVITIISVFGISILAIITSIIRNAVLNKKIMALQIEQNRTFKNPLDL